MRVSKRAAAVRALLLAPAGLILPLGHAAHADELLVMPYACTVVGGQPVLTPGPEQGHRIYGHRDQRKHSACSPVNPDMCRQWTVHRFDLDCDGRRVSWVSVVAASNEGSRRAWLLDGRLVLRMGPGWSLAPDDPCAVEPGRDGPAGRWLRRQCTDRLAAAPPPVVEMPFGYAPMLGIDGIFVTATPTPPGVAGAPSALPPIVAGAPAPRPAFADSKPASPIVPRPEPVHEPAIKEAQPKPAAAAAKNDVQPPQPAPKIASAAPHPSAAEVAQPAPAQSASTGGPRPAAPFAPEAVQPAPKVASTAPAPAATEVTPPAPVHAAPTGGPRPAAPLPPTPVPTPAPHHAEAAPKTIAPASVPVASPKVAAHGSTAGGPREVQVPKVAVAQPAVPAPSAAVTSERPSAASSNLVSVFRTTTAGAIVAVAGLALGLLAAFALARRREHARDAGRRRRDISDMSLDGRRGAPAGYTRGGRPRPTTRAAAPEVPALADKSAAARPGADQGGDVADWDDRMPRTREEALEVLGIGIAPSATQTAIKKIVDGLRMSWHPDLAKDETDRVLRELRSKQINAAWDLLHGQRAEV